MIVKALRRINGLIKTSLYLKAEKKKRKRDMKCKYEINRTEPWNADSLFQEYLRSPRQW
jgi:hypothetical protein